MKGSSAFRPLNEDHAIESVKFSLIFTSALHPSSILAVERAHKNWKETLPAKSAADIDIDFGGRQGKAPGVLFAFVKPDATPVWSMHVAGDRIEIECFLYSRWQRVWGIAREYFIKVLEILSVQQSAVMVAAGELSVKDVFLTGSDYYVGDLLVSSDLVPAMLTQAGRVWHNHFGWVEPEVNGIRVLHNLNLEAVPVDDETAIGIYHYQMINTGVDLELSRVLQDGFSLVDQMMARLHDSNKALVGRLLAKNIAQKIGL